MLFGKRKPRSPVARRRGVYHPAAEALEDRVVLTAIDLANIAGPAVGQTGAGPYGVLESGVTAGGGAGFTVADVGDVNGDGFDDFLVGAPTITASGSTFIRGNGNGSQAYLVFGSKSVTAGTVDFRSLTAQQRIGDLSSTSLGQTGQTNPLNNQPGFNFDGITFTTTGSNGLGSAVAAVGDVNGDGIPDFMIGAPGAPDLNGANPGTGRAYLIFGSSTLGGSSKTVDLDNPGATPTITFLTFVNNTPGALTGSALSAAGSVLGAGTSGVAIGAPGASLNGLANSGAVYVVPSSAIRNATPNTQFNLSTVGQTSGSGVVFTGERAGDSAGFSVAPAGDVDGDGIGDLLIGSPSVSPTGLATTRPGSAYLVYGTTNLFAQSQPINGFRSIILSRLGQATSPPTQTGPVSGAIINGANIGDQTGFSVSTAGDFNKDGLSDILIGSPGASIAGAGGVTFANAGRVTMIYGQKTRIAGTYTIGSFSSSAGTTINFSLNFNGVLPNGLAGYSLSAVKDINGDGFNEILIGEPGANNQQGVVFLIPGQANLTSDVSLDQSAIQGASVAATVITVSNSTATPSFLGSSVSGNLFVNSSNRTLDGDTIGDFVVGSAGFALPLSTGTSNRLAGGAFALEGAFVPLGKPTATGIPVQYDIDQPTGPFNINAQTPAALNIFVFSNSTTNPQFHPVTDIDPTTIKVNGIAFPGATIAADPKDENGDGIPDAIITITPRASLNLPSGNNVPIPLSGQTKAGSPFGVQTFTGFPIATGTVTGGVTPTPPPGPGNLPPSSGIPAPTQVLPLYGERLVPTIHTLSKFLWKPLPYGVAFKQFIPNGNYAERFHRVFHPTADPRRFFGKEDRGYKTSTLAKDVFTRGRTNLNKPTHAKVPRNSIP